MAELTIEATPSDDLARYELQLDDDPDDLPMGEANSCSTEVMGECGDGSRHRLYYVLVGDVGATLQVLIKCDGVTRVNIPLEVFPPGPIQRGDVGFRL